MDLGELEKAILDGRIRMEETDTGTPLDLDWVPYVCCVEEPELAPSSGSSTAQPSSLRHCPAFVGHSTEEVIAVGSADAPDTNISARGKQNDVHPARLDWSNLKRDEGTVYMLLLHAAATDGDLLRPGGQGECPVLRQETGERGGVDQKALDLRPAVQQALHAQDQALET